MTAVYSLPSTVRTEAFIRGKPRQFATRRPWRELFGSGASYSVPYSYTEFQSRLNCNLKHFRVNYAMIALLVLFLSLVYHPISMIVFILISVLWLLLYFSRTEPIVVLNFSVDDRVVMIGLGLVTIAILAVTGVWLNVLVSVLISAAVIGLHAAFRVSEDMFLGEDEAADGGLVSVVGA
ncbi:PRA1 family protein E-like [Andrographis paniculata]|uniref:PRA1 family protein E-like n=1 Tax=Andrographis paniculata TaxID=175694 RepID=UPI0021E8948C|nr:PRA1 family protein E-like [Andrographis paniculata]